MGRAVVARYPGQRKQSVAEILREHWQIYGRNYYSRHDYEEVNADKAQALIDRLRRSLPTLPEQIVNGAEIAAADDFFYHDPVDGSESRNQGIRILFADGSRIVSRLSGTGTIGRDIADLYRTV
jgi:phosphoglucomutase